jgi:hypothetical protein
MKDKRCKCSMSISLVGDGCRYCQPQEHIDTLSYIIEGLEEETEATCVVLEEIKEDLLLRADVDFVSGGKVVNLSASLWLQLNEIIDEG